MMSHSRIPPSNRITTADTSPNKIVCPKCGGDGEVQIVVMGEEKQTLLLYGKRIPRIGSILLTECNLCDGRGSFSRKRNRAFYEFIKGWEDLSDDSRVPIVLVHSVEEVVEFLRKMFPKSGKTRFQDFSEPIEMELEVLALSISERFQANGLPYRVKVHEISSEGVGIRHTDPIRSNFLLIQLVTPSFQSKQFVTSVVHCQEADETYESWCEFVM